MQPTGGAKRDRTADRRAVQVARRTLIDEDDIQISSVVAGARQAPNVRDEQGTETDNPEYERELLHVYAENVRIGDVVDDHDSENAEKHQATNDCHSQGCHGTCSEIEAKAWHPDARRRDATGSGDHFRLAGGATRQQKRTRNGHRSQARALNAPTTSSNPCGRGSRWTG
jgi:hypothetical protein